MIRLIKRYGGGSRKLYDTEESRYVSLDDIAGWVRQGQQLRVMDSATEEDVTAQTLAQVIYESHRSGTALLPTEFLHEAIRRGGRVITRQVDAVRTGVRRAVAKLPGADLARSELRSLRSSLKTLEESIASLERAAGSRSARAGRGGNGRARRSRRA